MSDGGFAPTRSARRLSGFSLARQWRLTRKELAETLRDRRTIVTLLVMPLLVYPLLSIIFRQFLAVSLSKPGQSIAVIGVDDEGQRKLLATWLATGDEALRKFAEAGRGDVEPPFVEEPRGDEVVFELGSAEEKLKIGRVDVAVTVLSPTEAPPGEAAVEIAYHERSAAAAGLRSFIERRLRAFNLAFREARGAPPRREAVAIQHQVLPAPQAASRSLLPAVVPLVLLMMTITGAVYPAIDLTAGERERGTLEALIAAPVSRLGVLMAKYVAVLAVALLTAGMNLAAMSLTIYSAGLMSLLIAPGQSSLLLAAEVLGLLLLFACFFSAVLLVITSFAKSFKEAQAYLIPLMLVTLAPGLLSLSPELTLSLPLAVTPLVNVVLLARDVFSGGASLLTTLVVVISTLLYAAAAIALAARIFGSDAILYGSGGSWSDLFRRPKRATESPSLVAAMFCLAAVFAAAINLGGAGSLLAASAGLEAQIVASGVMTLLTFAAIPLIAAQAEKVRLAAAFRTQNSSVRFCAAGALLGVSLGLLIVELTVLLKQWKMVEIGKELEDLINKKAAELNELPLPLVLLAIAVIPPLAEELFFRGYLFRALLERWGASATIVATAVAFGAFHAFGVSGVTLERLLPSLLMGLVLGMLAWQSGSVWPGVVLHALNNSLLLLIARYKDLLVEQNWIAPDTEHLPPSWLAGAAGVAAVGMILLLWPRGTLPKPISTAQAA
jgi:ABC-2 type transport system permease protein/sodium transport system permease protein